MPMRAWGLPRRQKSLWYEEFQFGGVTCGVGEGHYVDAGGESECLAGGACGDRRVEYAAGVIDAAGDTGRVDGNAVAVHLHHVVGYCRGDAAEQVAAAGDGELVALDVIDEGVGALGGGFHLYCAALSSHLVVGGAVAEVVVDIHAAGTVHSPYYAIALADVVVEPIHPAFAGRGDVG